MGLKNLNNEMLNLATLKNFINVRNACTRLKMLCFLLQVLVSMVARKICIKNWQKLCCIARLHILPFQRMVFPQKKRKSCSLFIISTREGFLTDEA